MLHRTIKKMETVDPFSNRYFSLIVLIFIVLLGVGIRLIDLYDPPLDFHPVRQIRSALIARSIYYQNAPDVQVEIQEQSTSMASLEVYEPPILESIVGFSYVLIGSEKVWLARVYNAIFWGIGGLAIAGILRRYVSIPSILTGLIFYFFLPFSVVASRSFQPEPWMVMWVLLTAWALCQWEQKPTLKWAVISGLFGGMAILVKVVSAFFVLGMLILIAFYILGWRKTLFQAYGWLSGLLMVAPTALYYLLFHLQRSSDFLSFWVVALSWLVATSEFYADWLAMIKTQLGLMTFILAPLGTLIAPRPARAMLLGLWTGYVVYGLVFPYQYITHEYYHLPLVGIIALNLPFGFELFLQNIKRTHWIWRFASLVVIVFAGFYGAYVSRGILISREYSWEPMAWKHVAEMIPEDEPFIALTADYGMRLRYFGGRSGEVWPTSADLDLKALTRREEYNYEAYFNELTQGKKYFVVTAFAELKEQTELAQYLNENCFLFYQDNDVSIYLLDHDG